MARPKRALGELGKVTYTVEPNGLIVARARVYDGSGKERRPSGSGATEDEALTALQAAADVAVGRLLARRTQLMTVAELATAWLKIAYHDDDPRVLRQRREQTVDGYASVIRAHIIPRAGAIPITDITSDRADGLLIDIARDNSVTTANKVRNVMSLMFDWAIQQGLFSAAGSIQNTRYGAVVVANPVRATRRADEPDTVYFELDAVQVKYILHLVRDVWPERHRARYPVGRRPNYKLLADYILITLGTSERTAEPIAIQVVDVEVALRLDVDEGGAVEDGPHGFDEPSGGLPHRRSQPVEWGRHQRCGALTDRIAHTGDDGDIADTHGVALEVGGFAKLTPAARRSRRS